MNEIGINVKVNIYDHPEYCEQGIEECIFINAEYVYCELFKKRLFVEDFTPWVYKKCDKCKKQYKEGKKKGIKWNL